jgi:peptidoglycan lytic transglycosylase G
MTIRDGGRPRVDRRKPYGAEADPYAAEADPYDATTWPGRDRRTAASARRRRGGGGLGGLLRFLIFALVLAAVVLTAAVTVLRPVVRGAIVGWAGDNPAALGLPFVADLVREDLGASLDRPASNDATEAPFTVNNGDTARTIAQRLQAQGFLTDARAFVFIAMERGVTTKFNAGDYIVRRNMTPTQLVALLEAPPADPYVDVGLREGLRLEQITAKLQTLPLKMDVKRFYELAKHPPASLIEEHPWLAALKLPAGTSLEGFLYPATYSILPETTADELISLMLDKFEQQVGDRMKVPKSRGLSFYKVLTLASIVEHEAVLDEERPVIAGVYQNRLNSSGAIQILNADPVVFYALDTLALAKLEFEQWQQYVFWKPPGVGLSGVTLPNELAGYQSYRVKGLPPGPICTPSLASLDAALAPNTANHYLYFLAIPNGGGSHVFEKTYAEHQANQKKYGYTPGG